MVKGVGKGGGDGGTGQLASQSTQLHAGVFFYIYRTNSINFINSDKLQRNYKFFKKCSCLQLDLY